MKFDIDNHVLVNNIRSNCIQYLLYDQLPAELMTFPSALAVFCV